MVKGINLIYGKGCIRFKDIAKIRNIAFGGICIITFIRGKVDMCKSCFLSCSILKREVLALKFKFGITEDFYFIDAWYEEDRSADIKQITHKIWNLLTQYDKVYVLFGGCYWSFIEVDFPIDRVMRMDHQNCYELLLGNEEYQEGIEKETAYILPEKISLWAQDIIPANVLYAVGKPKRFIYLDTGLISIPYPFLRILSGMYGIPYDVRAVSLAPLSSAILSQLGEKGHEQKLTNMA